jgi:hypothetical protein
MCFKHRDHEATTEKTTKAQPLTVERLFSFFSFGE